jgi:hypothetical protein
VSVNGKPARTLGAARRSWRVDLRGRARTQVSVRIVTTARNGHRYASTRVYQPCKAGTSRALPTILLKRTK